MIIKDSNLRTVLFSNRYKILAGIIAIILISIIIPTLNEIEKEEAKEAYENRLNTVKESNSTTYNPEKTVISGGNVSKTTENENEKVIQNFVKACNEKQVETAYNMLTDECKEDVFFSNIEYFKKNYVDRIFNETKTVSIQSWIRKKTYTYLVKYTGDMLSTGKIENSSISDYITIVQTSNGYKLNINEYIGREVLDKTREKGDIEITVKQKEIYKDYETYKIEIKNNSLKTIMLDSKKDTNTVYLQNEMSTKYPAFMYEVDDTKLIFQSGETKEIEIRFNKIYSSTARINYIVFEDIIADYEQYSNTQNKEEYKDIVKMGIEL